MKNKKNLIIAALIVVLVGITAYFILNKQSYAYQDGGTYSGTTTERGSDASTTQYLDFNAISSIDKEYSNSIVFKAYDGSPDVNKIRTIKAPGGLNVATESDKLRYTMTHENDELVLLFSNSAINLSGELMDVVIRVKVTGMKDEGSPYVRFTVFDKYTFIGQGKNQSTFVPVDGERNNDQHITINKGEPLSFGLGAEDAHALFTISYYKSGTVNTDGVGTPANISKVNSFFHDIDVPGSDLTYLNGDEGIVPYNGASKIYYNKSEVFPSGSNNIVKLVERGNGIAAGVHTNYTHSSGNDTDGVWYQSAAFMTTDNLSSSLSFMYGGTGCGIFFSFFSPYRYTLPDPTKVIVENKTDYYVGESFTYKIAQYIPNNYWGQQLGFNSVYSNIPATTRYSSFSITDTINSHLTINSGIKVVNDLGTDLTSKFTINVNGQTVTATAKSELLGDPTFYSHYCYLEIPVTIKTSGVNVKTIPNTATRKIDDDEKTTNEVIVNIYYKLVVRHLELNTNTVLDPDTSQNRNNLQSGDAYNSHKSELAETTHRFVRTSIEPSGTITDHNVEIIYYYTRAVANLYKIDSVSKKHLPGAVFEVYDASSNLVAKWTTTKDVESCNLAVVQNENGCIVNEKLKPNAKYTVKETKTPVGYATAKDVEFTTDADGFILGEDGKYTDGITIKNEPIRICIISVDMNDTPIPGMKVDMTKLDGSAYDTKKFPFITENDYTCFKYVKVDDYNIDEIEVVGEYIKEGIKKITVKDTPEVQNFIIYNKLKAPKTSLNSPKILAIIATVFAAFGIGMFVFVKRRNKKAN